MTSSDRVTHFGLQYQNLLLRRKVRVTSFVASADSGALALSL